METFIEQLFRPFQRLSNAVVAFIPDLLAMVIIITAGLVAAWVARLIVHKAARAVNLDPWCDRMGFTAIIRKAGIWSLPSVLAGSVVYGFFAIVFIMIGLSSLRAQAIDDLISQFVRYIPNAFSAVLILVIGYVITGFVSRAVLIAAVNSGYQYAKLLAEAVRLLLVVLTLAMALEQLHIAPGIVVAAFSIVFGGIVLALAISFGVGGIDAARRIVEKGSGEKKDIEKDIDHL